MKRILASVLAVFMLALALPQEAGAESAPTRIKDIAKVQGVRSNQLVGYGIVVGLPGTGDSKEDVRQSIRNMLLTFGITIPAEDFKLKNSAAVMVTATLPPFVREGDTIDVTSSSIGDAKSLQGGTLLQTPLKAANGQVYAVAQGAVSTGGFVAGTGGGGTAQKNFPTVGITPNGAIVERSVEDELGTGGKISLSLSQPDFTTAARMAASINAQYGGIATAANPGRIDINVPAYFRGNVVGFVATIEDLPIVPDNRARVVLNERTGTIVMGGNVTVDECSITQGGLTISVQQTNEVEQPPPFSYGSIVLQSQIERSAGLNTGLFIMPVDITNPGTEVIVRSEGNQGIEVQVLKSYGVGIDCHSRFIAICVHVRNNQRIFKYMSEADTDWDSLIKAKEWVIDTIQAHSDLVPDLRQPLHYVIEATSTYHMPILRAWGGIPSVINPMLAGATKKKTDNLDAERLSFHDLTGV